MACDNIYQRCCDRSHVARRKAGGDSADLGVLVDKLMYIKDYLSDLSAIARSGAAEVRHEASQRRRAEARRRADAALAVESEVVREEPEQDEVHVGRERSQARPRRILDPRVDLAVSTLARGLAVAVEDRICAPEEVPVRGVSIAIELKSMRFMLLTCSL